MNSCQHADHQRPSILRSFFSLVIMVAFVFGLSWLLRTYVFQPYEIPSGSMEETIMTGDMVFSEKVSYYFREPAPGDIVTFQDPEIPGRVLIKRGIAVGGQTDPEGRRSAPTVLVGVPEGSPVLEEEIFGPILPVLLYRSLPELVEAQRQKPRPLALYLFTRSRSVERAVLEALPFGGGCVNDTVVHLADPRLPFGGVGNSGMGACHGKAGFDAFTHEKSVLKKGRLDIPVRYPPYGKKHLGILKKLM